MILINSRRSKIANNNNNSTTYYINFFSTTTSYYYLIILLYMMLLLGFKLHTYFGIVLSAAKKLSLQPFQHVFPYAGAIYI